MACAAGRPAARGRAPVGHTRPGVQRYAARAAVDLEQRLVADAQRQLAPQMHMTREEIAAAWGTHPQRLEEVLQANVEEATARLDNGLRLDQGAALTHVLSSPRVCEVLVGPAGTGKTRWSAAEGASLWARARWPGDRDRDEPRTRRTSCGRPGSGTR